MRARPSAFARYRAASAALINVDSDMPLATVVAATPMLTVR